MSYAYLGAAPPGLPPDVAPTLVHETLTPVERRRGWVAVPTRDMREYVKAQILTAVAGFMVGVGVGAVLGDKKLTRNGKRRRTRRNARKRTSRRTSRRTSARRRKKGRPAGGTITELLSVTMGGMPMTVTIDRSVVRAGGHVRGWVHDLGTSFRSVPRGGGAARSFGTLAGAVKHVIRKSESA